MLVVSAPGWNHGIIGIVAAKLLEKYKKLLGDIEETENQLKSELAAALAHHFSPEADA